MQSKNVQMEKIYCIVCGKYKKFKKPKTNVFEKRFVFSIICSKCGNTDEKVLKEEKSIDKFLV